MIEAVTFDYWNTLVFEGPHGLVAGRLAAWRGLLEEAGHAVDETQLASAHQRAFDGYQDAWRANRQFVVADATEHMLAALALDVAPALRTALTGAFAAAGLESDLQLCAGVDTCLRRLHGEGVKLGIVCDVGLTPSTTLRAHLERWDLLGLFGAWAFSDDVGVYKPDARLFRAALDPLGAPPGAAAHVGDRLRTDVDGARALGMVSVRYRGVYDDPETGIAEADHVVSDYADFPALVLAR